MTIVQIRVFSIFFLLIIGDHQMVLDRVLRVEIPARIAQKLNSLTKMAVTSCTEEIFLRESVHLQAENLLC
jgi:hypothetical protein